MSLFIDVDSEGFTQEEFKDIKLCLETLFSIRAGEQPLDRSLGIDYNKVVSMPPLIAENILAVEIIDKVRKYEPRVSVEEVHCKQGVDGQLIPHVKFLKNEELEPEEIDDDDLYSADDEYDEEVYYEGELEV